MTDDRSPLPRLVQMATRTPVDKNSPDGRRALAEFNAVLGFDFSAVAEDDWWSVARDADGQCDVLVTADGMRVMARFAPRPDAMEFTDRVIAEARRQRGGEQS